MRNAHFILGLLSLFVMSNCSPEEVEPVAEGSMSCTLNGEYWEAISFENILTKITVEPKGKRLDVQALGMGIEMTLAMTLYTNDLDNSMPLVTYKTNSEVYGALVVITDGAPFFPEILGGGGYGEISVTAINPSEKTISGVFEFESNVFGGTEDAYIATDGILTNLSFTVQ